MQPADRPPHGSQLWLAFLIALGGCNKPSEPSKLHSGSSDAAAPDSPMQVTAPSQAIEPSAQNPSAPSPAVADVCAELREQRTYVSREDFACGPPVEGRPAPRCHSRIEFVEGTYQWRHTDMVFTGTYTCEGVQIRGDGHHGVYDPDTRHLRWEGVEYVPEAHP